MTFSFLRKSQILFAGCQMKWQTRFLTSIRPVQISGELRGFHSLCVSYVHTNVLLPMCSEYYRSMGECRKDVWFLVCLNDWNCVPNFQYIPIEQNTSLTSILPGADINRPKRAHPINKLSRGQCYHRSQYPVNWVDVIPEHRAPSGEFTTNGNGYHG